MNCSELVNELDDEPIAYVPPYGLKDSGPDRLSSCRDCKKVHLPRRVVCCIDGTWMGPDGVVGRYTPLPLNLYLPKLTTNKAPRKGGRVICFAYGHRSETEWLGTRMGRTGNRFNISPSSLVRSLQVTSDHFSAGSEVFQGNWRWVRLDFACSRIGDKPRT